MRLLPLVVLVSLIASAAHTALDLGWVSAGLLALVPALWLNWAFLVDRHEVVAVRADADFGRLALLDDGRWEGAVPLAGLQRPVDVEIEAEDAVDGPSLAQRLAYQDACSALTELMPELAEELDQDLDEFQTIACFLRLRLPARAEESDPDWALSFVLDEAADAECFEVRVRAGEILEVARGE